jgi:hypothetical protein
MINVYDALVEALQMAEVEFLTLIGRVGETFRVNAKTSSTIRGTALKASATKARARSTAGTAVGIEAATTSATTARRGTASGNTGTRLAMCQWRGR